MNVMRKAIGFVLGLALAAFALTGFAAPAKQFSIDVSLASVAIGAMSQPVTVVVSNETPNGNSSTNSMNAYVPAGLTVTGTVSARYVSNNNTYPTGTITVTPGAGPGGSTVIAVPGMSPLKPQQKFKLTFNVDVSTTVCATLVWKADAWTGSSFSGDVFNFIDAATMAAPPFNKTVNQQTVVNGSIGMVINPLTTKPIAGTAFPVTVTLTNACLTDLSGISPSLSRSAGSANGFTVVSSTPTNSAGTASYSVKFTSLGTATLKAQASGYSDATLDIKVFDGVLSCAGSRSDPVDALEIDILATTLDSDMVFQDQNPGDTGFILGVRGFGDNKPNVADVDTCTDINYGLTNNIQTDSPNISPDPLGNVVPDGYFSFTWDASIAPVPVVAIKSTYRPEWGDVATGLPTRKTLVCKPDQCLGGPVTNPADWKPVTACLDSLVDHGSMPANEKACLVSEVWNVLPVSSCDTLADPDGDLTNWVPRCLQVTSIMIVGKDPVFGR